MNPEQIKRTEDCAMSAHRSKEIRLAIVQHGDYEAAFQLFSTDQPEPYAGMKTSVRAIEQLIADRNFLLISLDAPRYRTQHHAGTLLGLPLLRFPTFVPRRVAEAIRRAQVIKKLRSFAPTHLLLRTCGRLASDALGIAEVNSVNTLVMFANVFNRVGKEELVTKSLVRLLNQPFVNRVGNHRQPATDSMIESGLSAHKAVAYDFDDLATAPSFVSKPLRSEDGCSVVFAASLIQAKGGEDVIAAVTMLLQRGLRTRLTVFGDGPELPRLKRLAAALPTGTVTFSGRRPNKELLEAMRAASFVCVPTHTRFPEGSNLVLTQDEHSDSCHRNLSSALCKSFPKW